MHHLEEHGVVALLVAPQEDPVEVAGVPPTLHVLEERPHDVRAHLPGGRHNVRPLEVLKFLPGQGGG